MSMYEHPLTVSEVRHEFGTFFDRVRCLYNLSFFKEEKGYRAEVVKRYADKLFEANRISIPIDKMETVPTAEPSIAAIIFKTSLVKKTAQKIPTNTKSETMNVTRFATQYFLI